MKTKFFFFVMLVSVVANAQSTVQITPISATYTSTPTIRFKVSWTNQTATNHRNKVWVFVDFQPVVSPTQKGSWQPATITGTVQKTAGTVSEQSNRGFFLEGTTTNFASTITVTLGNVTGKFNWCAYATDYPPNATMASGTYTLKGSPPFKITYNGSSYTETTNKSFTLGCIASLTDATGCPGIITYPAFAAGALGNGSWGSMGEFLNIGGTPLTIVSATAASGGSGKITYKWFKNNAEISGATAATYLPPKADAATAGTFNYTRKAYDGVCNTVGTTASGTWTNVVSATIHPFTSCSIYVARYDITTRYDWATADANCKSLGSGWRLPTMEEFRSCLGPYRVQLNLMENLIDGGKNYWTSTTCYPTLGMDGCIGLFSHVVGGLRLTENPLWGGAKYAASVAWGDCGVCWWDYARCVKNQ